LRPPGEALPGGSVLEHELATVCLQSLALAHAGATIKVLDFPSLDLPTPEGRGFLAMFSAMAERERLRIVARTREGRPIAMTNGVKMGPPFKLQSISANS
jgi:DNA invertase Pin-like site-specific DNA recombinase